MATDTEPQDLRDRAIARIKRKREFYAHLIAYLAVNAFLVLIWATVARAGFFWPMFPMAGWGIGVFFHGWDVWRAEPSEGDIQREMRHLGR